ncbi:MAG TPA: CehA/McbA family metallohydrolase [Chthoniobacter sp.]
MNSPIRLANPMRIPRKLPHLAALCLLPAVFHGAELPTVTGIETQPLAAQVRRLGEALDLAGAPLNADEKSALDSAAKLADADAASAKIQRVLDRRCLVGIAINPEMRVKVVPGPAEDALVEQGWTTFLIKVANQAGTTAPLNVFSPQAESVSSVGGWPRNPSDARFRQKKNGTNEPIDPTDLWLDLQTFDKAPLQPALSGLGLEYRVLSLYSRDAGKREATLSFDVGQGTQDLGFRSDTPILFTAAPAREITLRVRDELGAPTTASFIIRDAEQRVYPSTAKRLAPDFGFQPQIYRADGEKLRLPDGDYTIEFSRGPESIPSKRALQVNADTHELAFQVERWIDPAKLGWWSGDHHIHAAGCAHYTNPTEGVLPQDMMRHCLGEDLKVGANLTWGPCFDYQKQFFTGHEDKVSRFPYILRYDIEVSGFGSHQSGHLCLLRLRDQIYPGGESDKHWPTLGLSTLRWAKAQGALVGPAHSGWGLQPVAENDPRRNEPGWRTVHTSTDQLPNYIIPPFNGIGANEYIVDVTHELPGPDGKPMPAVDFMSMVDTPYPWELNIWYHTLNVGFRTRISGETDFPCIYQERVGLGRSYVKLPEKWTYEDWCEGIRAGRNYVSDGYSHLLDFQVDDVKVGENGSELRLEKPGTVHIAARVAARLQETPNDAIRHAPTFQAPYWNIERARIGDTREVPVEVIVNGQSVATKRVAADGKLQDISFDTPIDHSSWVALRILASSHTNPVFVLVGGSPIRASKRSAEWCRKSVDQCWSQKQRTYAEAEQADAEKAYDHARQTYDRLITECLSD